MLYNFRYSIAIKKNVTSTPSNTTIREISKNKTLPKDDLNYAYNIYQHAHSTTKIQESALSQMTIQNEDKRLALLDEIENKRAYLTSLIKCELEIKNLTEQTHLLNNQKQILTNSADKLADKLKNLDMLKNSVQPGLNVKGLKPGTDMNVLKDVLDKIKKDLYKVEPSKQELHTEIADVVMSIEKKSAKLSELQKKM
ncbi:hypothetical protein L9F63_000993 [Diploptera punctata]|uniref:Uncharacterized protein n=1 Tax=Diploptera punctata TaxID=6984 RepID=A0AAD8ESP5_DIPPU|nr:hypothetical protein L9F63_000993 [Diploptera punctata]